MRAPLGGIRNPPARHTGRRSTSNQRYSSPTSRRRRICGATLPRASAMAASSWNARPHAISKLSSSARARARAPCAGLSPASGARVSCSKGRSTCSRQGRASASTTPWAALCGPITCSSHAQLRSISASAAQACSGQLVRNTACRSRAAQATSRSPSCTVVDHHGPRSGSWSPRASRLSRKVWLASSSSRKVRAAASKSAARSWTKTRIRLQRWTRRTGAAAVAGAVMRPSHAAASACGTWNRSSTRATV